MASRLQDPPSDLRDDASTSSEAGHPSDFDAAADMVAVLASGTSLTDGLKLELYGLYKQAMCGPCCSGKPAFWDRKGRAKWSGNAHVLLLCTSLKHNNSRNSFAPHVNIEGLSRLELSNMLLWQLRCSSGMAFEWQG